jgi:hypothetical protein
MAIEMLGDTVLEEIEPVDPPIEDDEEITEAVDADEPEDDGETKELVVTIGDDPAPAEQEDQAQAPTWVRELRKSNRELVRKQRELEAENTRLKGGGAQVAAPVALGAKPTLAGCEYDEEKFDRELEAWHGKKAAIEDQKRQAERTAAQENAAWQAKLAAHAKAAAALKVRDYADVEATVQDALSPTQQGIIVNAAKNSSLLVYALGKNPKRLAELAAIKDPVAFTWAAARLETELKTTTKTKAAPPPPERVIKGGAVAGGVDKKLESLRAKAAQTGDLGPVQAYKRQLRDNQR